jgi:hypothetical protein
MTIKGDIFTNIVTRLQTITETNGYALTIKNVFADLDGSGIPMGLNLEEHEIPAILLWDGDDPLEEKHQVYEGSWEIMMQLINTRVSDIDMMAFGNAVRRAIYANSPTAQRNDAWRAIHPSIIQFIPLKISTDLNMIEANRIQMLEFMVKYRARPYEI